MSEYGFIRDMLDVKVLILYVADLAEKPMSVQDIYELCYQDDRLTYFDVCEAIPQLTASGHLEEVEPKLPLWGRFLAGSAICTFGELLFGLLFNRDYRIWDYRGLPMNWGGQICLYFTALWIPVSAGALWLYRKCSGWINRGAV